MTRDETRGHVGDVLAIASLSDSQTIQALFSRVNGASVKDMLIAALSLAREQTREIAELRLTLADTEASRDVLEHEIEELRDAARTAVSRVNHASKRKQPKR